jgi:hypothetical protein
MRATLLRRSWLKRVFRVETSEGSFEVVYNGRGGRNCEAVYIDGQLAIRNERLWFGPVLIFPLGNRWAAVEVRAWPWLTIRSLHLLVEDEVLYAEGERHPVLDPGWVEVQRERARAVNALLERIRQEIPWMRGKDPSEDGTAERGTPADRPRD